MSFPTLLPRAPIRGAVFSPCRTYRYQLWRRWDVSKRQCVFVMLNPSTADIEVNDPTVERCERRARQMGMGGLDVVNIFALRSTQPLPRLKTHPDPVGQHNNAAILAACLGHDLPPRSRKEPLVVCAWGHHGTIGSRSARVRELLSTAGVDLYAIALTHAGEPRHPLYLAYEAQPTMWKKSRRPRRTRDR